MNQTTQLTWRGASHRALRRLLAVIAIVAFTATSGLAAGALAQAASQNEIIVTRLFDGTAAFTKADDDNPVDNGSAAPAPHTPGLDSGSTNNVVRTHDLYGVQIDWNVNEEDATNVMLTVTAPSNSTWAPDASGMFAGCDPAKSSIDGLVLTCWLGDLITQGSHGVIRPTAILNAATDNDTFNVSATLTTGEDPVGLTDEMDWPLTVSEAPAGDWIKYKPTIRLINDAKGEPDAYIAMFPIGLLDSSQRGTPQKGAGSIDPTVPVTFYDHVWNLADGTVLASADDLTAAGFDGDPVGTYAQGGALPNTAGDWTFADVTPADNPFGYHTYAFTVTNYSNVAPELNANDSENSQGIILTGQAAFRLPYDAVQKDILASEFGGVEYTNLISNNPPTDDMSTETVDPIPITGSSVTDELGVDNNAVLVPISNTTSGGTGGDGGSAQYHYANIAPPATNERQARIVDFTRAVNGIPRKSTTDVGYYGATYFDGRGELSRGTPVNLEMFVSVKTSSTSTTTPIHGCMTWDPQQLYVTPMADVVNWEYSGGANSTYVAKPPTGYFEDVAFGTSGGSPVRGSYARPTTYELSPSDVADIGLVVEYAYDPSANVIADNQTNGDVECNNTAGREWIASTDTAAMQAYLDPSVPFERYTFNMVRVRTQYFPWARLYKGEQIGNALNFPATAGLFLSVSAMVGIDKDINFTGKSVYIHSGRASGTWNPVQSDAATYAPDTQDCYPDPDYDDVTLDWEITKWCSQPYAVAAENPTDPVSSLDKGNFQMVSAIDNIDSDTDRVTIVDVRPAVTKKNVNGIFDVKDNGQLVQFDFDVSAVGAKTEALTDVTFSDPLPANYQFVRFVTQPATSPDIANAAPACWFDGSVAPNGVINCRFSEEPGTGPVPADVTDLPEAIPGGWSDTFRIEVRVNGAVANANTFKPLTNTATISSNAYAPWDPVTGTFITPDIPATELVQSDSSSARSYMPFANDYAYSGKTIDASGGACTINLMSDVLSMEQWQERCSLVSYDNDPSNTTTTDDVGNIKFTLNYTNDGNTALKDIAFVDVLPYNGDGVSEPGSSSGSFGADPSTVGDARTPGSSFSGQVGYVSVALPADAPQTITGQYFTAAAPSTISRDPLQSWNTITWCDDTGAVVNDVAGPCPADPFQVTAVYVMVDKLLPDASLAIDLTVDTEGAACYDYWTNTAGARSANMSLPVRTNDVTAMVNCTYDLALQKRLNPTFDPTADANWATPGVSVVPFDIEVINQGQGAAIGFTVTDYVETSYFRFDAANNPAGTSVAGTLGTKGTGPALDYTWTADTTKPSVAFTGELKPGESTIVTIYLTVTAYPSDSVFVNYSEISEWDNDGNPSNGSSLPSDAGSLVDVDSTPDTSNTNDALIDNAIDLTPATGDEDDHDIALVPVVLPQLDLALRKTLADGQSANVHNNDIITFNVTVFNQGNLAATNIGLIDYLPPQLQLNDPDWLSTSPSTATYTVAGPLQPGDSVVIPITVRVIDVGYINNYAEITGQTPVGSNGVTIVDENGNPITDIDSTPDTSNSNDALIDDEINLTPATGDEDDHDIASLYSTDWVFDLALRKTLSTSAQVATNDLATYQIEVFNQGEVEGRDIRIADYLPAGTELADSNWTPGPNNTASYVIPGPIQPGTSVKVNITVRITATLAGDYVNIAEITNSRPTFPGGETITTPDGKQIPDIDSVADNDPDNDKLIDNEINLTPATGDEDDHDIARLAVAPVIPSTGSQSLSTIMWASAFALGGLALLSVARRRRRTGIV